MARDDELPTVRRRPPVVAQTPANTAGRREEILLSASVIPEISLEDFLDRHLPHVDATKVTAVTKELKNDPAWRTFIRTRPVIRIELEPVVFAPIPRFYTFVASRFEVADSLSHVNRT